MAHAGFKITFEVGVRLDDQTKTHLAYAPVFGIYAQGNSPDDAFKANTRAVEACFRALAKTGEVLEALRRYEIPIYGADDKIPESRRTYARALLENSGYKNIRETQFSLA